jgi:hypothetical protein
MPYGIENRNQKFHANRDEKLKTLVVFCTLVCPSHLNAFCIVRRTYVSH